MEAVDSSEATLRAARMNCDANGIGNVELREADVFELLAGYAAARRHFDIVVLDPPAFAKSRQSLEAAVRGYQRDQPARAGTAGPGRYSGDVLLLASFERSGAAGDCRQGIARYGRKLRVLERRMQAQDHPVLLTVPETLYLKCLILEVI